jgi:hypothetical protein
MVSGDYILISILRRMCGKGGLDWERELLDFSVSGREGF